MAQRPHLARSVFWQYVLVDLGVKLGSPEFLHADVGLANQCGSPPEVWARSDNGKGETGFQRGKNGLLFQLET